MVWLVTVIILLVQVRTRYHFGRFSLSNLNYVEFHCPLDWCSTSFFQVTFRVFFFSLSYCRCSREHPRPMLQHHAARWNLSPSYGRFQEADPWKNAWDGRQGMRKLLRAGKLWVWMWFKLKGYEHRFAADAPGSERSLGFVPVGLGGPDMTWLWSNVAFWSL